MIERASAGILPDKPHTAHRLADGRLLQEEMFTRGGFAGPFSYFYHARPITPATRVLASTRGWARPVAAEEGGYPLKRRLYDGNKAWTGGGAALDARTPVLFNDDLCVMLASVGPRPSCKSRRRRRRSSSRAVTILSRDLCKSAVRR